MKSYIHLTFKQGRNLAPKDANGASDPYIKTSVFPTYPTGNKPIHYKSKFIPVTLNPEWNFVVVCYTGITKDTLHKLPPLKVEVWDKDTVT